MLNTDHNPSPITQQTTTTHSPTTTHPPPTTHHPSSTLPPLACSHLMQLLCDVLVGFSSLALVSRVGGIFPTALGTAFITLFYSSLLSLAKYFLGESSVIIPTPTIYQPAEPPPDQSTTTHHPRHPPPPSTTLHHPPPPSPPSPLAAADPFDNEDSGGKHGISINADTILQETNIGIERWRRSAAWLPDTGR